MTGETSDFYLVNSRVRRRQSAIAALLGGAVVAALSWLPDPGPAQAQKSTHMAIPSALFDIARTVCQNNGGYRDVVIERKSDQFTFRCADGMTLRDTIVRVK